MGFSELFIRRLVLSTVAALFILLLGGQGILNLPIRQYPKVDETVITITTPYSGASADLMQGFITTPISKSPRMRLMPTASPGRKGDSTVRSPGGAAD